MNYNFEQFREYTAMYETARKKDEKNSEDFYRLVKYVAAKTDENGKAKDQTNMIVRDFLRKYDLNLIEIPEEFKDVAAKEEDIKPPRKNRVKRPRIYTRSDKNLHNYDVWRCFDRNLIVASGKDKAVCKLLIPPALLKRAFGFPDKNQIGFAGTGQYEFEDTNLDLFRILDYKQTTLYHGLNREESFYLNTKNIRKPDHKRNKPWPSVEEFWNCEEPKEFRLLCTEQADWRKFKRWFNKHL